MYTFLLLPLFLHMGVFLQCFGVGFFALMIPAFLFYRAGYQDDKHSTLLKLSIALIVIYLIFPVSNIVNYLFLKANFQEAMISTGKEFFKTSKLFSSRISGGIFGTSLLLMIIAYFSRPKASPTSASPENQAEKILKLFSIGSLIACFALFLYASVQHFTGFDYRLPGQMMPPTNLMNDGRYRAMGLYGHPLSLAGSSLALFCFFYSLAWKNLKEQFLSLQYTAIYLSIALGHICIIFLSGSRFAALIAFSYLIAIPIFVKVPAKVAKYRNGFIFLSVILIPLIGYFSGIFKRFKELNLSSDWTTIIGERSIFWKVHWQMFVDQPFWGQGYAFVTQYLRTYYYNTMGYEKLVRKYNAHNAYLETATCVGIIGTIVILFAGYIFLKQLHQYSKDSPISKTVFKCFLIALSANAINGLTQNTAYDATICYQYIGMFMVVIWISRYHRQDSISQKAL